MELYLMQHGQAVAKEENPDRPLSKQGIAGIQASAAAMKRLGIKIDLVICSPKKRSFQTAALVAEGINYPYSDILKSEAVKATAPASESIDLLKSYADCSAILITGHLPSLSEIASAFLANGSPVRIRFDNGGLCRIDVAEFPSLRGELAYYLPAALMQLLGGRS